jgi:hypothetical protein
MTQSELTYLWLTIGKASASAGAYFGVDKEEAPQWGHAGLLRSLGDSDGREPITQPG